LPEYQGKVITYRYGVYNIYYNENRQICLEHLIRDFKRFAHIRFTSLSMVGKSIVKIIDLVFASHNVYNRSKKIDRLYYLRRMRKIKKRMLHYLKTVLTKEECE